MSNLEKAAKGTAQYEEWLRKYNEKRKKKEEAEAEERRKKAEEAEAAKRLLEKKKREAYENSQLKSSVNEVLKSGATSLNIEGRVVDPSQIDDELINSLREEFGYEVEVYDNDKLLAVQNPVQISQKDWFRMSDINFVPDEKAEAVARSIKDKDKAIARAVAASRISGDKPSSSRRCPFYDRALELGATKEEIRAAYDASPEPPEYLKERVQRAIDHRYNSRAAGQVSRAIDRLLKDDSIQWEYSRSTSGNAVTDTGREAMARNGRKWTIGNTIIAKKDGNPIGTFRFDAITDEGGGPNSYATDFGRRSVHEIAEDFIRFVTRK